jgi:hypothetical protein
MKIIDKRKDYYDYLVGTYGLDPDIVFDRRGSITLNSEFWFNDQYPNIGAKLPDTYKYSQKRKEPILYGDNKIPVFGLSIISTLSIGKFTYNILLDRYVEEDGETIGGSNHIIGIYNRDDKEKYPISFILDRSSFYGGNLTGHYHKIEHGLLQGYYAIDNVILNGTWITKLFPATKVWEDVYDFLSSQKDKEIIDTRTDKEKIISAGFDTKTSFRNIK